MFENKTLPVNNKPAYQETPFLKDVSDGSIYKQFQSQFTAEQFKRVYSFTLNTDGVSLCEKSKLSIWPVYLALNEIEIYKRFDYENILVVGLFCGHSKPDMKVFINDLYANLSELEKGK